MKYTRQELEDRCRWAELDAIQLADNIDPDDHEYKYLFHVARFFKYHPDYDFRDFDREDQVILKRAVKAFCARIIETEKGGNFVEFEDEDECWDRFVDAWHAAKYAPDESPVDRAECYASEAPIALLYDCGIPSLHFLASVMYYLAQENGHDSPIFLDGERAATLMGKGDKAQGCRYLRILRRIGLIEKTKDCIPHQKAAEHRFCFERTDLYHPPSIDVTQ